MRVSVCQVAVRRARTMAFRAICVLTTVPLLMASEGFAQTAIICDGVQVGTVNFAAANAGVTGGFTATFDGDGDGKASLDEAAAQCGEDHFNWYQTITSDNNPPNDADGNLLVPPYVDPPPGGYGPPSTQWADELPWYWDEGPDPPGGTPGFSDGFHLNDNLQDNNGDGVDEFLSFADFPGGADGNSVTFRTWLVSLNADGSLHSFHDGGIEWTWTNPVTPGIPPNDRSDWTSSIDLSLAGGPTFGEYELLTADFATSVPTTVWDTVVNSDNSFVSWGAALWTRDGEVIGETFPGGVIQPGIDPPEVRSDHKTLPETPNDFHFAVLTPDSQITVWSFWDSTQDADFGFEFQLFEVPGVNQMDLQYFVDENFLLVLDQSTLTGNQLYNGPLDLFDPSLLDIGFGPGFFTGDSRLAEVMALMTAPLEGDFNEDGDVDGDDFLAWQAGFGIAAGAEHSQGDADGDGDVDGDDFLLWQSQFGNAAGNGGVTAVPEPAAWLLLIVGGMAAMLHRRTCDVC